jgi:hypothetical protein
VNPSEHGRELSELIHEAAAENPKAMCKAFDQVIGESVAENTAVRRALAAERARADHAEADLAAERERNAPLRVRIKDAQDRADRAEKEAQRALGEHWSRLFRPLNEAMATERKLESETARADRAEAALVEMRAAFGAAARSYHNIARHGGPPYDFENCGQQVCIWWRAILAHDPDTRGLEIISRAQAMAEAIDVCHLSAPYADFERILRARDAWQALGIAAAGGREG